MTRLRIVLVIAAALLVVLVGLAGWYFFIRDDAPPPLTLAAAVATTTIPPPELEAPATAPPGPAEASVTAAPDAAVRDSGDPWTIDQLGTIVGYRIEEELARIGGNTAVGRTSQVTGSLVLEDASITEMSVTVDMTTLESDDRRRDRQLRTRGLQTNEFPEATFTLDEVIDIGALPAIGVEISETTSGTLTLHGVSRTVMVEIKAQLIDASMIVVVGSVEVALTDYEIEPPTGLGVLTVADVGAFEFQLTFRRPVP